MTTEQQCLGFLHIIGGAISTITNAGGMFYPTGKVLHNIHALYRLCCLHYPSHYILYVVQYIVLIPILYTLCCMLHTLPYIQYDVNYIVLTPVLFTYSDPCTKYTMLYVTYPDPYTKYTMLHVTCCILPTPALNTLG